MLRILRAALAASLIMVALPSVAATGAATGVDDAVETHIKRGAPRPEDLNDIQAYVARHPDDIHGRFVLGELLASGGFQELAEEQFDIVSKAQPRYVLDQFHALMKDKSWETAGWLGFYVQKHFADDSGVSFAIGRQWLSKGNKRKADQFFQKALTQQPVWPTTYQALSALRFAQSRRDEAIRYADEALKLDPADESAAALKTASLAELSGHPERYLPQLQKYAPRNWMNDSLSTMLAQAYINTKQWEKALPPALQGLKYSSAERVKLSQQQINTLMHHVSSGEMIKELNYLSPLRTQDFNSTVLRMRFARCLSDIGAHVAASKLLLEAMQQHSFFTPMLNYRLGEEMEALHKDQDSLYFYRTAHQLRPEEVDYQRAYERAQMRFNNQRNDLARQLKRAIRGNAHS